MDDEVKHEVLLAFTHRGRQIELCDRQRLGEMWLKENPWTYRHRTQRVDYEQAALRQGHVAVNSVLRDWIKGQVTAIETGVLSFEAVFMPYMLTADGRPRSNASPKVAYCQHRSRGRLFSRRPG